MLAGNREGLSLSAFQFDAFLQGMSSASARSSISSGGPGRGSVHDNTRVEAELVQWGNLVGKESLEWSLNFLTRNCDFLNERSMSPLSIYAVHVWTGSQSCEFVSKLSFQGKIRNALFKLLIHPIHELVNSLKTNAYYNAALSSEKPFDFDQSISSCGLEIPLISGRCYDGDFILSQMKWVYRLFFQAREEEAGGGGLSLDLVEDEEFFTGIAFPDSLKEFSKLFCSKVVFHWLTHHILTNFLYNPNGPISLLSFNVLIEKLSPFFSRHGDSSRSMCSDILAFSDSVCEIWGNIKEKSTSSSLLSVVNSLEKCTSDSEAFMNSLAEIAIKHPLDELLDNLSELIIAINDALPCTDMHARVPTRARPKSSPLDVGQEKSIAPDADPKEPFNSIFEAAGFRRAVSVCREFPELLRPKESYSEKVVRTTRLVLNYCLRNNLADVEYIRGVGSGQDMAGEGSGSDREVESSSLEDRDAATDERDGGVKNALKRKTVFREDLQAEEEGPKRQSLYYDDKGRTGRKISVRGFSESSDSSEEATPGPRLSEARRSDEQQPAVARRESVRRRASASPTVSMSRQYRRWSDEETSLLIDGVNKFGLGKWRAILLTTKLNRDEVGLKDRWRNLIKGGHVTWDSKTKRYRSVKE